MGLRDVVVRRAVRSAHVLVVEVPGHALTRLALERACRERGWHLATTPADADVLAVCGSAGPELAQVVDRLWEQVPGPRARIDITAPDRVREALEDGAHQLVDEQWQRTDAVQRASTPPQPQMDHGDMGDERSADCGMDHAGIDHGSMDHEDMGGDGKGDEDSADGGMDHGDMGGEGMEHGSMDMDMDMAPGGIPLAEGGDDRDSLEMDVLHVRLGPVLPDWPGGLVLRCSLQGDVIVEATLEVVDGESALHHGVPALPPDAEPALAYAALRCDAAARLLRLAGAPAAADALRVRDDLLDRLEAGLARVQDPQLDVERIQALRRGVERSRLLRWSLGGLATLDGADLARHRLTDHLRGDVRDRLLAMLDLAADALAQHRVPDSADPRAVPAPAVEALVTGLDLATARLVLASLDLDPATVAHSEAAHA